jgi:hypothetical protein
MRVIARWIFVVTALLLRPGPAIGSCDLDAINGRPVAGPEGYGPRAGGSRCEGLYESAVAGEAIQLVSLTSGRLLFDPSRAIVLSVRLVAPVPVKHSHVRAVGIAPLFYYQMDADIGPGQAVSWPVGDVLARLSGIRPGDVGIYAVSKDHVARDVFEPVVVTEIGQTLAATQPITAVLRPQQAIDNVRWRFSPTGGAPTSWQDLPMRSDRAELALAPDNAPLVGRLEVRWDDPSTGSPRAAVFLIGG